MHHKKIDFENDSIFKLLLSLSIPAITAQLVNALYNIVDRIYIGNMEIDGALALTGVGICFPILILISAFAVLIGFGGAPILSIKLGEKKNEDAEKILGNCFTLMIVIGISLTIITFLFKEPMLRMFGASDSTFNYANDYLSIYLLGTVFVQISLGMNAFINAQGFAKIGMTTVLIGAITNIILDPIFIFQFGLGVKGAALATLISQFISAMWVLKFLFSKKPTIKIKKENISCKNIHTKRVLLLGISPFLMQVTESILYVVLNSTLSNVGGDIYVGSMTIIGSLSQFILMPLLGFMLGAQPIISYNYGAKRLDRVKETIKKSLIVCLGLSSLFWLLIQINPQFLIGLFTNSQELIDATVPSTKLYLFGLFAMGAQICLQQSFISLGKAAVSIFLASLRKLVLLIPLVLILSRSFGVVGVFISAPIADIITALCTILLFTIEFKKILNSELKDNVNIKSA
ncbi:MAG: MATE family efflux transporter [Oscillospiraceae bacterium]